VLLALAALLGCEAARRTRSDALRSVPEALREAVLDSVDDPKRQAQALDLIDDLDHQLRSLLRANQALDVQSGQLFADYGATKRDFDQMLTAAQKGRDRARQRLIDVRLELAALLTAAEWREVAKADAETLASWTGQH
jgi:hypothetical protein